MNIVHELKRMKTRDFWKQVGYWSAVKWSGKKNQPISNEDWLPILMSICIGVIILTIFLLISNVFK